MDRLEKIHSIKEEVKNRIMAKVKKNSLNYKVDETFVRRQIEAALTAVINARLDGHIDDMIRRFIIEEVVNEIFGLGPIDRFVNDPGVWEIMVNGPKEIYVEREGRLTKTDAVFEDEEQLYFYIERILSPSGRRVTEFEPYIDARLPDGSRLNVVRKPVAPFGPVLTIRKARHKILGINELIEKGTVNDHVAKFLKVCVRNHLNIIMAGGPGSGKTTIMNILGSYILPDERVITIEDTLELELSGVHRVALETRPSTLEGKGEITIRDLVRNALHMRPDRIIIGEVRGEETLDMLQCMNIGRVGSMTTLHANSPLDALLRLETMSMMGNSNVSAGLVRRQIISAIDLVITMDRLPDGRRRVIAISEIQKSSAMEYELRDIYGLHKKGADDYELRPSGYVPSFLKKFKDSDTLEESFFKPWG